MEWFEKHTDTVIIVSSIVGSMLWMNSQFNAMNNRFASLEKDLAIVKTILIIKNIMPSELAKHHPEAKQGN